MKVHSYYPHYAVEEMCHHLINLINEAKKNNAPCCPEHQLLPKSFVLDQKHYDWVLKFCRYILLNEDIKSMDMAKEIAKNEGKNGAMICHSGFDVSVTFLPFYGSDEIIK